MIRLKILGKVAAGLVALVVPLGIAIGGGPPASADPGACVSGPFGYAYACVQTPGWIGWPGYWDYGPRWHDGGGDDQGEDD